MKLSTRKIISIEVGLVVTTVLTILLVSNAVVRSYLQAGLLVGAIAMSMILLGWAKARGRDAKFVGIAVILAAVTFQVLTFLLLGLKLGFVTNVYAWNFASIFRVFLPVALVIMGEEILRGQLVEKGKASKLAVVITGVTLWVVEIAITLPLYDLGSAKDVFSLVVLVTGPAALTNILLTYIAFCYDYRINIVYRLVMSLPVYLLPILPDAGDYLPTIFQIGFIFLVALGLAGIRWRSRINAAAGAKNQRPETDRIRQTKKVARWVGIGVAVVVVVGYVALMSGLFHYYLLAIGSGSMEPNIARGDLVLVERYRERDELEVGDILVYKHSNVVMVHRISEMQEQQNGDYAYTTKGDANKSEDEWTVGKNEIIGVVKGKIIALGFPTLWLNELFNK